MANYWLNTAMRHLLRIRMRRIRYFSEHPHAVQEALLSQIIQANRETEWGRLHGFNKIKSVLDFQKQVPIQDYETLKPAIGRMMHGEKDVLCNGRVLWFAKSSGTTNDKSKFIPVTIESLKTCHLKGGWDSTALLYDRCPDTSGFAGKMLFMGGNHEAFAPHPETRFGDVSAIMIEHLPSVANFIFTPDKATALMPDFEQKIERMAQQLIGQDLRSIGGVPTWTLVLLRRILEITQKENISEVFPNLTTYVHGGVSFTPYKATFSALIPNKNFNYWEIYNATEGFFATQSEVSENDLLLLLNNGIYYEFMPESEWNSLNPRVLSLKDVEIGKNYALVITTNSGLWRYVVGDTVVFTSTKPYKILISGRTKQFVNAFGEELMVANADRALADTCALLGAQVSDYTVAPIYFKNNGKGGHEWLVEFEKEPADMEQFNNVLDSNLQKINSDYEAKRYRSMAMERLSLQRVPRGTFHNWLKSKGKYGGQSKVPRLANNRQYVDEILSFVTQAPPSSSNSWY
jgi:hypothetical protein